MTQKVFITGCPKSGATLLKRLFFGFHNVGIFRDAMPLSVFDEATIGKDVDFFVAMRATASIFSSTLTNKEMADQLEILASGKIKVVNVIRDGRDVIKHGDVWCDRWMHSIEQATKYGSLITHTVKYEDIIYHPSTTQNRLAQRLNLKPKNPWNTYPDFVKEDDRPETQMGLYPLTDKKIGSGKDYYKLTCPGMIDRFEACLELAGYGGDQ